MYKIIVTLSISSLIINVLKLYAWCDSKIEEGFDVPIRSVPFMVSVHSRSSGHVCGGFILKLNQVVTACHCVASTRTGMQNEDILKEFKKDLYVYAGGTELYKTGGTIQRRHIWKILIHPKCNRVRKMVFDIGLVFLEYPFQLTEYVKPASIVTTKENELQNLIEDIIKMRKKCYVAGWGEESKSESESTHWKSPRLKSAIMTFQDGDVCNQKFRNYAPYGLRMLGQMCIKAYNENETDASCIGDFGGPIFCDWKVYGVVSFGANCGSLNWIGVAAPITDFVEWYVTVCLNTDESHQISSTDSSTDSQEDRVTSLSSVKWCIFQSWPLLAEIVIIKVYL